jgi:hypothetical protein
MGLENTMHIGTASVGWKHRQTVGCIRISMVFVQIACNLVGKHCKLLIITQFARITMQNTLPVEGSITLWLIISDTRAEPVCQKPALFGSCPRIYAKSCKCSKYYMSNKNDNSAK